MRWEYLAFHVLDGGFVETMLNAQGAEGWELVAVDNGVAYFKRPVKS